MTNFSINEYKSLFLEPLRIVEPISWIKHIPFAFFIIELLKPKIVVELGVHTGNSFSAFCQAVKYLNIKASCYGVDTFKGDPHSGVYDEFVYIDINNYITENYGDFAQLMRMTFDEALEYFSDGSIDLLHIDGYHTYEAVKHDFESWLPKMSDRGVILLHDTQVRRDEFGAWKLWEEISKLYPSYEFKFGYGLGVLAVGKNAHDVIIKFIEEAREKIFIERLFFTFGSNIEFRTHIQRLEGEVAEVKKTVAQKDERVRELEADLEDRNQRIQRLEGGVREIEMENLRINTELNSIKSSVTWRTVMKWHSFVEKLMPPMTRRRRWYELGINGLTTIVNEGWKSFWWKYKQHQRKKKEMIRDAQHIQEQRNYKKSIPCISYKIKSRFATHPTFIKKIREFIGTEGYINFAKTVIYRIRLSIKNKYGSIYLKFISIVRGIGKQQESLKMLEDASCLGSMLPIPDLSNKVACTIVSKNYLPMAFVLAKSFKANNPDWDFKILLCDMIDSTDVFKYIFTHREGEVMPLSALLNYLEINELEELCFKYTVIEMNTAIKPYFLEYLLKVNYEKVVYLDPDILVLQKFDEINEILNTYNIVLIPHILTSLPNDNKRPTELDIIRAGTYNLGFIALNKSEETIKLLKWWQNKLIDYGFMNVEEGMHVDQKWMDFAPSFFDKVYILKKKNYNVAYWNLHERKVWKNGNTWVVENYPLTFFHFSGFMIDNLKDISKHQNRYSLKDFPKMKDLFILYRNLLIDEGILKFKDKKYWFDYLPGTDIKIPEFLRKCYKEILSKIDNPYNPDRINEVINMANDVILNDPPITRLCYDIYIKRTDLQKAFPNLEKDKNSRALFAKWIRRSGREEYYLDDVFIGGSFDPNNIFKDKFGINLFGYFENTFGIAEVSRTLFKLLLEIGVPFCLFPIKTDFHEKIKDADLLNLMRKNFSMRNPYSINLICANADDTPHIFKHFGNERFERKYNIGVWFWELEDYFPFSKSFEYVDEVWCFSEFIATTLRKHTTKPVIKFTYPFMPAWRYILDPEVIREKLKIAIDNFVFYFSFDFHSGFERKNPEGIIEAFLEAFPSGNEKVTLLFKTLHADNYPKSKDKLKEIIKKDPKRIIWLDTTLTKEELASITNAIDCYISLHRSEGLGLTMAEAMYLGKCVIATSYGGNLAFMNNENSILIDYSKVTIKDDFGPYKKGQIWAEPDIDEAAKYMRALYEDRKLVIEIGKKAAAHIRKKNTPKKTALEIFQRLYMIKNKGSLNITR